VLAAAFSLALVPVSGAGHSFRPDVRFTASSLTGWRTLGDAEWRADRGEIVGVPTRPGGGWIVIDRSYQDVAFHASVRCLPGCRTGVLLRTETTPAGMKGVFVSIADGEPASYAVTLDAHGREVERTQLRAGGGQTRIAPPPDPGAVSRVSASAARGRGTVPAVTPPLGAPDTRFRQKDWNEVEIFIDANIVRPAVLYWYRTVRNPKAPGGAELVPELIHNQSGAGSDLLASDLNGDGRLDIVTATRFGTFIFWGRAARR
jgi:hypothetical protein